MRLPRIRAILLRLALSIAATLVGLLVAEVLVRLLVPQLIASAGTEREFFCEFDPTLGWAPIPNITARHEQDGFSILVRQNAFGLRAGDSIRPERQSRQTRILVLGDSYVWGYGVEQWQIMTAPEVHRSSLELINFGVSGYGTDQEYLFYSRLGTRFDVDEVVLVFTPYNDVAENMSSQEYDHDKPFFTVEGAKLVLHTEHIRPRPLRTFVNRLRFHSRVINIFDSGLRNLRNWLKLRRIRNAEEPQGRPLNEADVTARDRAGVALTLQIIDALRAAVSAQGARFSVVFVPYKPHVLIKAPLNHPLVPLLAHGLAARGITYYEPYDLFLDESRKGVSLFNVADNHFNAAGNALFARVLVEEGERRSTINAYDR
jgi:lysophospholipase L1-like esterase